MGEVKEMVVHPGEVHTVRCLAPNCTAVKGSVNHWLVITIVADNFMCEPHYEGYKLGRRDYPVCGRACAQKMFEKYLTDSQVSGESRESRKAQL